MASYTIVAETKHPLISLAVKHWHSADLFSDEQVHEVKSLFREMFAHDGELSGSALRDALMLRSQDDAGTYYVAYVQDSPKVTWMILEFNNRCFGVSPQATLMELFMIMDVGRKRSDREEILGDFFGVWRRHYSPERIRRVTGRSPGDPNPLLQNGVTLRKMLKEARLLGFHSRNKKDESRIYLDWVDPEMLANGYAPQGFAVTFDDGYDSNHQLEFDSEAWATDLFNDSALLDAEAWANDWLANELISEFGVYIHEDHGPFPFKLHTWGDWDRFIERTMRQ